MASMQMMADFNNAWLESLRQATIARGVPAEIAEVAPNLFPTDRGTYASVSCDGQCRVCVEYTREQLISLSAWKYTDRTKSIYYRSSYEEWKQQNPRPEPPPLSLERWQELQAYAVKQLGPSWGWKPYLPLLEDFYPPEWHMRGMNQPLPITPLIEVQGHLVDGNGRRLSVRIYVPGEEFRDWRFEVLMYSQRGMINQTRWFNENDIKVSTLDHYPTYRVPIKGQPQVLENWANWLKKNSSLAELFLVQHEAYCTIEEDINRVAQIHDRCHRLTGRTVESFLV